MITDKIRKLAQEGFEDLHVPVGSLVKLIDLIGHEFPLLVNGAKIWIHTEGEPWDGIAMERDISDGSITEIEFDEEDEEMYQMAVKRRQDHFELTERLKEFNRG